MAVDPGNVGRFAAAGAALAVACALACACASTDTVTESERAPATGSPAPERVLVYDFAFDPAHVALNRAIPAQIARGVAGDDASDRDVIGRRLGRILTDRVVGELWKQRIASEAADAETPLRAGDLVVAGQFVTIDEGDRFTRTVIGLGAGATELRTRTQLYLVRSEEQAELLKVFHTVAKSSAMPSITTSVAGVTGDSVEAGGLRTGDAIAEELVRFFTGQGWIRGAAGSEQP